MHEKSSRRVQEAKKKSLTKETTDEVDKMKGGAILKPKFSEIAPASGIPEDAPRSEYQYIEQRPPSAIQRQAVPSLIPVEGPPGSEMFGDVMLAESTLVTRLINRVSGRGAYYDAPDVRHAVAHSLQRHPKLLQAYLSSRVV